MLTLTGIRSIAWIYFLGDFPKGTPEELDSAISKNRGDYQQLVQISIQPACTLPPPSSPSYSLSEILPLPTLYHFFEKKKKKKRIRSDRYLDITDPRTSQEADPTINNPLSQAEDVCVMLCVRMWIYPRMCI
jgi:hypothetical protein